MTCFTLQDAQEQPRDVLAVCTRTVSACHQGRLNLQHAVQAACQQHEHDQQRTQFDFHAVATQGVVDAPAHQQMLL